MMRSKKLIHLFSMLSLNLHTYMETIVNKVSQSGLMNIDLEEFYDDSPRVILDIKDQLYLGLMLKEKEFRDFIKTNDWEQYKGKHVAVICSTDAIVPTWAYMLISVKLSQVAKSFLFGSMQELETQLMRSAIDAMAG